MSLPERAEEAADELYGLLPGEFVAHRNALAAQAKADGDGAAAKAIAGLRKPTQAGWLVNLLVRQEPEQITNLLELGTAMRRAQSRLAAKDLKALSAQRQKLVRAMASQAYELAVELGEQVSRTALNQVEDTLSAALADPASAEQVRGGRLLSPLTYSGFGPAGLTLVPEPVQAPAPQAPDEDDEARARRRAQVEHARKVQEATAAVTVASRALVKAEKSAEALTKSRDKAQAAVDQAQTAAEELENRLEQARKTADKAGATLDATEQALAETLTAAEQGRAALAQAQQTLDELEAAAPA